MTTRSVAVLIFDEVEVLDFAGPFEVFGVCGRWDNTPYFQVYTVSLDGGIVAARNGLRVAAAYSVATMPKPDIFVVPGGYGVRALLGNPQLQAVIRQQHAAAEQLLSVCTGAWLLADAGVLAGLRATTYHTGFDRLQELEPTLTLVKGERWVDNGKVVTSAGVSAGIDMALHVVAKLLGKQVADKTARYMEYAYWQ